MRLTHITFAESPVRLKVGERYHTFSIHEYCGIVRLYADGDTPNPNIWPKNSSFWPVFNKWLQGGKRVDEHGRGIVDES